MKNKKSFLSFIIAIVLIIPCIFMFSACCKPDSNSFSIVDKTFALEKFEVSDPETGEELPIPSNIKSIMQTDLIIYDIAWHFRDTNFDMIDRYTNTTIATINYQLKNEGRIQIEDGDESIINIEGQKLTYSTNKEIDDSLITIKFYFSVID